MGSQRDFCLYNRQRAFCLKESCRVNYVNKLFYMTPVLVPALFITRSNRNVTFSSRLRRARLRAGGPSTHWLRRWEWRQRAARPALWGRHAAGPLPPPLPRRCRPPGPRPLWRGGGGGLAARRGLPALPGRLVPRGLGARLGASVLLGVPERTLRRYEARRFPELGAPCRLLAAPFLERGGGAGAQCPGCPQKAFSLGRRCGWS